MATPLSTVIVDLKKDLDIYYADYCIDREAHRAEICAISAHDAADAAFVEQEEPGSASEWRAQLENILRAAYGDAYLDMDIDWQQ